MSSPSRSPRPSFSLPSLGSVTSLFQKPPITRNVICAVSLLFAIIVFLVAGHAHPKISEHIGNTKTALWHTFRPSNYTTYHPSHGNNNPGAVRDVSPFQNTMAYVRWNTDAHPERMPTLKRYEPFFHTLHFSMPKYVPDKEESFVNLTHDNHWNTWTPYQAVASTMEAILNASTEAGEDLEDYNGKKAKDITGIWFMHFDAFVDPLKFWDMDFERLWILDSRSQGVGDGAPWYLCMKDKERYKEWYWWNTPQDHVGRNLKALMGIVNSGKGYDVGDAEWCSGWADMYYVPRRYFQDYIFLSKFFTKEEVFHEMGIATIFQIIDRTRRTSPYRSVIFRLGDCFGSCCEVVQDVADLHWRRCGHKIDYQDEDISEAHFERLEKELEIIRAAGGM